MPSVHDAYQRRKEERRNRWGDLANRPQCEHKYVDLDVVTEQKCRNFLRKNNRPGSFPVLIHTTRCRLCPVHAPKTCQKNRSDGRRCQAVLHQYHVHCRYCQDPNDDGDDICFACSLY